MSITAPIQLPGIARINTLIYEALRALVDEAIKSETDIWDGTVWLQKTTPGTQQTGNINISGTVIAPTFDGNATTSSDGLTSATATMPLALTLVNKVLTGAVAVTAAQSGGAVALQPSTPGLAQAGHINVDGNVRGGLFGKSGGTASWILPNTDSAGYFKSDGVGNVTIGAAVPTGTVAAFYGNSDPTGWFIMDGRTLASTLAPALAALLGGGVTFTLPDARGRFILGVATSGTGNALGSTGGLIDHRHTVNIASFESAGITPYSPQNMAAGTDYEFQHTHMVDPPATDTTGANPPFLALSWIIKT